MNNEQYWRNTHDAYHAHVYYDQHSLAQAEALCAEAGRRFGLAVGRLHQRPVGPHPCWSCQISFDRDQFETFIPWLDQHRQGLTVLIHALSGDDWADHSRHVHWLGEPVELKLGFFSDHQSKS